MEHYTAIESSERLTHTAMITGASGCGEKARLGRSRTVQLSLLVILSFLLLLPPSLALPSLSSVPPSSTRGLCAARRIFGRGV